MAPHRTTAASLTRRTVLSVASTSLSAAVVSKPPARNQLPQVGEFSRFSDAVTETTVVRLTSLSSANFLTRRDNRSVSVKGRFLVFSSDRSGSLSPFRLDLRSGQITQLLSTGSLQSGSLCLDASGRSLCFLDGGQLKLLHLATKRVLILDENVDFLSMGNTTDELVYLKNGNIYRAGAGVVANGPASWCLWRPGGAGCLYGLAASTEICYRAFRSGMRRPARVASGKVFAPCWSPDGGTVFYLRDVSNSDNYSSILCAVAPDGSGERQIGSPGQFATFSVNADDSVFLGASRSKAQPTINLLLRNPPREFTLCEHRATNPEQCAPVFSADSRRIYFQSDFQGKPAIYSVNVEALIEQTDS